MFLYVVDTVISEEEMGHVRSELTKSLNLLPPRYVRIWSWLCIWCCTGLTRLCHDVMHAVLLWV